MLFRTLPESAPRHARRHPLTVAASFAAHLLLVASAIALTRGSGEGRPPMPVPSDALIFVAAREPDAPRRQAGPAGASRSTAAAAPVLPNDAPPELPGGMVVPDGITPAGPSLGGGPPDAGPFDGARTTGGDGEGGGPAGSDPFAPVVELGARVAGAAPAVRYPASLRLAGVGGRVVLEVVVDTLGRPEPATVRVVESAHPLLADAARSALLRTRFVPARAGDRAVRMRVRMPYDFEVR